MNTTANLTSQQGADNDTKVNDQSPPSTTRLLIGIGVILVAGLYTIGVLSGQIPPDRKIDGAHLAFLVLALLIIAVLAQPELLKRLQQIELGNIKLVLSEVRRKQAEQADEIATFKDIIPLLLSGHQRKYLVGLQRGENLEVKDDDRFRADLMRLRSMGLIRMQQDQTGNRRHISELKSSAQNLAEYVILTKLGEHWAQRIQQSEHDVA